MVTCWKRGTPLKGYPSRSGSHGASQGLRHPRNEMIAGTRPFPIDGPLTQSTAYRVEMDVIQGSQDRRWLGQVPIITEPFLPEPKCLLARTLLDRQRLQERRLRLLKMLLDPKGAGTFDREQQVRNSSSFSARLIKEMEMLRHDYNREQSKIMSFDRPVQSLVKQLPDQIIDEELSSLIAGERQFMDMTGLIEVADLFSVGLWVFHVSIFS